MTFARTGGPDFDPRIRRAQQLGAVHSFAAEVMQFYEHLALFQKSLYVQLAQPGIQHPVPASATDFRSNLDLAALLQKVRRFSRCSRALALRRSSKRPANSLSRVP